MITAVTSAAGSSFDGGHPASGGAVVNVYLNGLADPSAVIYPSEVTINVGGVNHPATEVSPVVSGGANSGGFLVRFVLSNLVPTGSQSPLTVTVDGRSSISSVLAAANN